VKPSLPILLLALAAGCAGRRPAPSTTAAQAPVEPVQYTYVVKASYPHLTTSYTQGLYFDDGFLWEGTGQYGASAIQRLDLPTGRPPASERIRRGNRPRKRPYLSAHVAEQHGPHLRCTDVRETARRTLCRRRLGARHRRRDALSERRFGAHLGGRSRHVPARTQDHGHGRRPPRAVPQRTGMDRRKDLGQRLHHRPDRHHRSRYGDGRRGRGPRGTAARRGDHPRDRRTQRHRLRRSHAAHFRHGKELEPVV